MNTTAVNHGRLPQGYARSNLQSQGSVSEVSMAGWVENLNGERLKFISCCHRKIRAKRRHSLKEKSQSEGRSRSRGLKEKRRDFITESFINVNTRLKEV